ncbi:hypothetical protein WG66_014527 [Moniliophthora roreri]|nr:hypothetical protein WG66_014527 [Moniliophthora roreri]
MVTSKRQFIQRKAVELVRRYAFLPFLLLNLRAKSVGFPCSPKSMPDSYDNIIRAAPVPTPTEVAEGSQAVNRSSVAALAFLLYDICLTFEDEVDLFWWRRWSFMKFNFFFIRYFPLLAQAPLLLVGSEVTKRFHFSSHDCFIWQVYQGVISILIIMSCDFILLARIHVLYFANPRIRKLVGTCYVLEIGVMCVGLGLTLPGIRFDEICVVIGVPTGLLFYGGAVIIFQTILFGLTLYKFITGVRAGWGNVPIVKLLMRDGTWAFFVLFIIIVAQSSLYGLENHAFAGILYSWTLTLYGFCGYRILLNINHLTRRPHHADTSGTISNSMQFTSPPITGNETYDIEMLPLPGSSRSRREVLGEQSREAAPGGSESWSRELELAGSQTRSRQVDPG